MNEQYKAALACLKDAKQHAVAAADYDMAAAINNLLGKCLPKPEGHTPGPWIKPQSSDGFTILGPSKNGIRVIVCNVPALSENMDANARLIVAAPDLLAACKAALPEPPKQRWPWHVILEAAIAKAEGDSK